MAEPGIARHDSPDGCGFRNKQPEAGHRADLDLALGVGHAHRGGRRDPAFLQRSCSDHLLQTEVESRVHDGHQPQQTNFAHRAHVGLLPGRRGLENHEYRDPAEQVCFYCDHLEGTQLAQD